LHAVVGPKRLWTVRHLDGAERIGARMRRGKAGVASRVPVLRQDHMVELADQAINQRHDLVAAIYGERAAGAKIVLQVDDDQGVGAHQESPSQLLPGRSTQTQRSASCRRVISFAYE